MTDCGCAGGFGSGTGTVCTCDGDGPPVEPFSALRATYGMLLGEDDFRVLQGNPRGKQMLHTSWLHGGGVVWGLPVTYEATSDELAVGPGLAVDGRGREIRVEARDCLTVRDWVTSWLEGNPLPKPGEDGVRVLTVWVVARFRACPELPVPALADPCDVTRRHDDFSRWLETVSLQLVQERPTPPERFPRIHALLGLTCAGDGPPATCGRPGCATTPAGGRCSHVAEDVDHVLETLAGADSDRRACALLAGFRRLAARDVTERPTGDGEDPFLFPFAEGDADVLLARVAVAVDDESGCVRIGKVEIDPWVRTTMLPTATIQELTCGFAPGVLGDTTVPDAGGPRLVDGTLTWSKSNTRLRFRLDRPAFPGSQERAVRVSALSRNGNGWSESRIDVIHLEPDGDVVTVELDQAPAYPIVRVIVKGTGPEPLYGRDPQVPFAGVAGGPPGGRADGHDAVLTFDLSSDPKVG